VSKQPPFDPYAIFAALERERVAYVVVGGFARIVHGSAETSDGLDLVPSLREENLRRLGRVLKELKAPHSDLAEHVARSEPLTACTSAGELRIVPDPWGTRGYDDLRIRAVRENLGRGARPQVASLVDCVRMLEASERTPDAERLQRLRRLMELERQLVPERGIGMDL
jgi:hypothetical protein